MTTEELLAHATRFVFGSLHRSITIELVEPGVWRIFDNNRWMYSRVCRVFDYPCSIDKCNAADQKSYKKAYYFSSFEEAYNEAVAHIGMWGDQDGINDGT